VHQILGDLKRSQWRDRARLPQRGAKSGS